MPYSPVVVFVGVNGIQYTRKAGLWADSDRHHRSVYKTEQLHALIGE